MFAASLPQCCRTTEACGSPAAAQCTCYLLLSHALPGPQPVSDLRQGELCMPHRSTKPNCEETGDRSRGAGSQRRQGGHWALEHFHSTAPKDGMLLTLLMMLILTTVSNPSASLFYNQPHTKCCLHPATSFIRMHHLGQQATSSQSIEEYLVDEHPAIRQACNQAVFCSDTDHLVHWTCCALRHGDMLQLRQLHGLPPRLPLWNGWHGILSRPYLTWPWML